MQYKKDEVKNNLPFLLYKEHRYLQGFRNLANNFLKKSSKRAEYILKELLRKQSFWNIISTIFLITSTIVTALMALSTHYMSQQTKELAVQTKEYVQFLKSPKTTLYLLSGNKIKHRIKRNDGIEIKRGDLISNQEMEFYFVLHNRGEVDIEGKVKIKWQISLYDKNGKVIKHHTKSDDYETPNPIKIEASSKSETLSFHELQKALSNYELPSRGDITDGAYIKIRIAGYEIIGYDYPATKRKYDTYENFTKS